MVEILSRHTALRVHEAEDNITIQQGHFASLAKDQEDKAIGVILSGTGSDGTRSMRAIKEMDGMAMAQDDSAKFDGTPRSAVSTNVVDVVGPPGETPGMIVKYLTLSVLTSGLLATAKIEDAEFDDRTMACTLVRY